MSLKDIDQIQTLQLPLVEFPEKMLIIFPSIKIGSSNTYYKTMDKLLSFCLQFLVIRTEQCAIRQLEGTL